MSARKISALPDFIGKKLLLKAQQRGVEIGWESGLRDVRDLTLIGLASLLVEKKILDDE